jgi:phosphatidylserine/phosphatidylglycerophosphate/cardiolipin synthase-like enzyme
VSTFATPVTHGVKLQRITPSAPVPNAAALRFALDPLMWVGLPQSTAIAAFATGSVARAGGATDGVPGNAASPWTAFQLSPLPQLKPAAFKAIPGGLPVQLVIIAGTAGAAPAADDALYAGEAFVTAPTGLGATAFLAFAFQDRLCRDPLSWAEAIALSGQCDTSWPQFVADLAALKKARNLRLLDHRGAPARGGAFSIAIDGGAPANVVLAPAMDGDTGIALPSAAVATVTSTGGGHAILATGDTEAGAFDTPLTLPAGKRFAQVLHAEQWLADTTPGVLVNRWNPNSFVEPIQEGTPYFTRLVEDMRKAKPNGGVELAGWAFVKSSLRDSKLDWPLVPSDHESTLLKVITDLHQSGVDVRVLVNQFMQVDNSTIDDFPELLPIMFVLFASLSPLQVLLKMQTDPAGYGVALVAFASLATVVTSPITLDMIKSLMEYSKDFKDAIDAVEPTIATWTPYPANFADNPLVTPPPFKVLGHTIDDVSHTGVYHQKYINIKKPKMGGGFEYVSYLGGIDINSDRVDTTLHRAQHPFHDVQVRITGPAIADVLRSYEERAGRYSASVPIPSAGTTLDGTGSHLVQIARTYFTQQAGSPSTPFTFAPNGENTPARTMIAAIEQARDFIYIEDQYFTPPNEYVQALLDAGDPTRGVRALIITIPFSTDQPYGQDRRSQLLSALQARWGSDRMHVGTPLRRYLHETPALTTNLGRMALTAALTTGGATATLAPVVRLPPPPFLAFIGNELVLVHALAGPPTGTGSAAAQQVEIARTAGAPSWGAHPVAHPVGTPVMAVQIPHIYVHAKVTIVDDIFLFVGSSNLNRRGLYHDGEMDSFTIPQHLRGDPANPARVLRSRLMAEHLGLTPEIGESLFADPISALPYFTLRSWYEGSRRQPLSFFGSLPPNVPIGTGSSIPSFLLQILVGALADAAKPDVWPLFADPSTTLDATPSAKGPDYP